MLSIESTGSGVPLVFLHAFPLSQRMWDVNKPALSKNFRFITIDFPGFGASPLSGDTSTMESMASQALEALTQIGVKDKFVAAGLSMGGYALLQLVRLAPERVRAAAFISTRSGADSTEGREKRFKNIELVQKEGVSVFAERQVQALLGKSALASNPALIDQVKKWIESAKPEAICAALRGMAARPDTTSVLDSLKIPALFLSGEEDGIIPSSEMETISKRAANPEFQKLSKAGHLCNLEQPTLFNDTFLHFLKRHVL